MSERRIVVHVKIHQNGKRTPRNRSTTPTESLTAFEVGACNCPVVKAM